MTKRERDDDNTSNEVYSSTSSSSACPDDENKEAFTSFTTPDQQQHYPHALTMMVSKTVDKNNSGKKLKKKKYDDDDDNDDDILHLGPTESPTSVMVNHKGQGTANLNSTLPDTGRESKSSMKLKRKTTTTTTTKKKKKKRLKVNNRRDSRRQHHPHHSVELASNLRMVTPAVTTFPSRPPPLTLLLLNRNGMPMVPAAAASWNQMHGITEAYATRVIQNAVLRQARLIPKPEPPIPPKRSKNNSKTDAVAADATTTETGKDPGNKAKPSSSSSSQVATTKKSKKKSMPESSSTASVRDMGLAAATSIPHVAPTQEQGTTTFLFPCFTKHWSQQQQQSSTLVHMPPTPSSLLEQQPPGALSTTKDDEDDSGGGDHNITFMPCSTTARNVPFVAPTTKTTVKAAPNDGLQVGLVSRFPSPTTTSPASHVGNGHVPVILAPELTGAVALSNQDELDSPQNVMMSHNSFIPTTGTLPKTPPLPKHLVARLNSQSVANHRFGGGGITKKTDARIPLKKRSQFDTWLAAAPNSELMLPTIAKPLEDRDTKSKTVTFVFPKDFADIGFRALPSSPRAVKNRSGTALAHRTTRMKGFSNCGIPPLSPPSLFETQAADITIPLAAAYRTSPKLESVSTMDDQTQTLSEVEMLELQLAADALTTLSQRKMNWNPTNKDVTEYNETQTNTTPTPDSTTSPPNSATLNDAGTIHQGLELLYAADQRRPNPQEKNLQAAGGEVVLKEAPSTFQRWPLGANPVDDSAHVPARTLTSDYFAQSQLIRTGPKNLDRTKHQSGPERLIQRGSLTESSLEDFVLAHAKGMDSSWFLGDLSQLTVAPNIWHGSAPPEDSTDCETSTMGSAPLTPTWNAIFADLNNGKGVESLPSTPTIKCAPVVTMPAGILKTSQHASSPDPSTPTFQPNNNDGWFSPRPTTGTRGRDVSLTPVHGQTNNNSCSSPSIHRFSPNSSYCSSPSYGLTESDNSDWDACSPGCECCFCTFLDEDTTAAQGVDAGAISKQSTVPTTAFKGGSSYSSIPEAGLKHAEAETKHNNTPSASKTQPPTAIASITSPLATDVIFGGCGVETHIGTKYYNRLVKTEADGNARLDDSRMESVALKIVHEIQGQGGRFFIQANGSYREMGKNEALCLVKDELRVTRLAAKHTTASLVARTLQKDRQERDTPTDKDVIVGMGSAANDGTALYRAIVATCTEKFLGVGIDDRKAVAAAIVKVLSDQKRRFLIKDRSTKRWLKLDKLQAEQKVYNALSACWKNTPHNFQVNRSKLANPADSCSRRRVSFSPDVKKTENCSQQVERLMKSICLLTRLGEIGFSHPFQGSADDNPQNQPQPTLPQQAEHQSPLKTPFVAHKTNGRHRQLHPGVYRLCLPRKDPSPINEETPPWAYPMPLKLSTASPLQQKQRVVEPTRCHPLGFQGVSAQASSDPSREPDSLNNLCNDSSSESRPYNTDETFGALQSALDVYYSVLGSQDSNNMSQQLEDPTNFIDRPNETSTSTPYGQRSKYDNEPFSSVESADNTQQTGKG